MIGLLKIVGMLMVGLLLVGMVLMAIAITAHAASKTPKTRVGETFETFRSEMPKSLKNLGPNKQALNILPPQTPDKHYKPFTANTERYKPSIGPHKGALRLPPSSSRYEFHHDIWHTPGKAMIHKECAYDFRNDPGEASCQTVWAHI